jgi:hypothetical protein
MSSARIIEEDVVEIIHHCEASNEYFINNDTGVKYGSLVIGYMTYWVEYRAFVEGKGYTLLNAYCHRAGIGKDAV